MDCVFYIASLSMLDDVDHSSKEMKLFCWAGIVQLCFRSLRNLSCLHLDNEIQPLRWKWFSGLYIASLLIQLGVSCYVFIFSFDRSVPTILSMVFCWIICLLLANAIDCIVITPSNKTQYVKHHLLIEEECFICQESYVDQIELDCGHRVHEQCLEKWLERGQFSCPYCRQSIV